MYRLCDYHSDFTKPEMGMGFHYFNSLYGDWHTHNYWEIFIVTEGTMLQHINDHDIIMRKGDMYIVRPEDVHVFFKFDNQEAQHINIMLTTEKMEAFANLIGQDFYYFLKNTTNDLCTHLNDDQYKNFTNLKDTLFLSDGDFNHDIIKFFVFDALKFAYFESYLKNKQIIPNHIQRHNHHPEIQKLITALNSLENMALPLYEICKDIPFSQVHINRLFKQAMGITLNDYFVKVKIKTAANLLANSNLTTLDIASKIGYSSLSYFNKAFKAIHGYPPREYTRLQSSNKNIK